MKKKLISTILLTAMLALTASCGESGKPSETTPAGTDGVTTESEIVYPDYGQKEFTILYRNEWAHEFIAEEETATWCPTRYISATTRFRRTIMSS